MVLCSTSAKNGHELQKSQFWWDQRQLNLGFWRPDAIQDDIIQLKMAITIQKSSHILLKTLLYIYYWNRLLFSVSLRELAQLIINNLSGIWLQATKGNLPSFSRNKIISKYGKLQRDAERLITQSVMWLWFHYVILPTRRSAVRFVHTHPKRKFTSIFDPWFLDNLQVYCYCLTN